MGDKLGGHEASAQGGWVCPVPGRAGASCSHRATCPGGLWHMAQGSLPLRGGSSLHPARWEGTLVSGVHPPDWGDALVPVGVPVAQGSQG